MADATSSATADQIVGVDLIKIQIEPVVSLITYSLRETWQSGKVTTRDSALKPSDFAAALGSFCQATPKKKFLTWLASNNYEPTLTPQ